VHSSKNRFKNRKSKRMIMNMKGSSRYWEEIWKRTLKNKFKNFNKQKKLLIQSQ
jgi:hypothetical protein